jgi:hypothetical protein
MARLVRVFGWKSLVELRGSADFGSERTDMTHVFTIVSCTHLAEARVLMESVARYWPEVKRTVFVTDSPEGKFDPAAEDFDVVEASQTSLPRFRHMAFVYLPSELCYVLKPFCAKYLFEKESAAAVVYLDADMLLFHRPVDLERALEQSSVVLTPHRLLPDLARPMGIVQLKGGTFNAGFFAVRNSAQGIDFVTWWGMQLAVPGNIDPDWHEDQSWLNLVPGFCSETHILRHPGYNVAFWNLVERRVMRATLEDEEPESAAADGDCVRRSRGQTKGLKDLELKRPKDQETAGGRRSETGDRRRVVQQSTDPGPQDHGTQWRVGFGGEEYPLVLFHFSLYNPRYPERLTGAIDWARLGDDRTLEPLVLDYAAKLNAAGFEECHRWPYSHGAFRNGKKISKEHREFFKKRFFQGLADEVDPFDPGMEPRGLGSLYNVDHPAARFVRKVRGTSSR